MATLRKTPPHGKLSLMKDSYRLPSGDELHDVWLLEDNVPVGYLRARVADGVAVSEEVEIQGRQRGRRLTRPLFKGAALLLGTEVLSSGTYTAAGLQAFSERPLAPGAVRDEEPSVAPRPFVGSWTCRLPLTPLPGSTYRGPREAYLKSPQYQRIARQLKRGELPWVTK